MTTTTTTTITAPAGTAPAFEPQQAGEGWSEYGRRAMLYALQLQAPCFAQLDNDGLQAAADACNPAMSARDVSAVTLNALAALQRELRARLAGRQADTARRVAALQDAHDRVFGADAGRQAPAAAAEVPPAGPSGGSKVRKPAGPRGPVPPAFQLPEFDLADAF
jgi:hypothetical protein